MTKKVAILGCTASKDDAPECPEGAKLIKLTQGKYAIIDEEDYDLASRFNWCCDADKKTHYAICVMYMGRLGGRTKNCSMYLHRLLMRPPAGTEINHINHNGYDCRRVNMRCVTKQQNQQNRLSRPNTSSQYKGVYRLKRIKRWEAKIKYNKKNIYLGLFASENQAASAYDLAAIKYFGEFASTNFPREKYT